MKTTLTAGQLIKILSEYPESTKVVLTLTERDLREIEPFELMDEEVRELRLPGDRSYTADENVVAFCVWG
ncbi:hypothetical protein ACYSUW_15105 [Pseudomonas frederiksbergensis]